MRLEKRRKMGEKCIWTVKKEVNDRKKHAIDVAVQCNNKQNNEDQERAKERERWRQKRRGNRVQHESYHSCSMHFFFFFLLQFRATHTYQQGRSRTMSLLSSIFFYLENPGIIFYSRFFPHDCYLVAWARFKPNGTYTAYTTWIC